MSNNELKYYFSFETLPIINWFLFNKSGDLRYFIKCDIDNLPDLDLERYKELKNVYEVLTKDLNNIDNKLQIKWLIALKYYFLARENKTNENKCNVLFNEYLKECDLNFKSYNINNKQYTSIQDAYKEYKHGKEYTEIFTQRYIVFDIKNLQIKKRNEWDLYDDIIMINKALSMQIDEFSTSVKKFNRLKEKTFEIIKHNGRK